MYHRTINGRQYVYKSYREGGKTRSRCVGSTDSPLARALAQLDRAETIEARKLAAERRAALEKFGAALKASEAPVRELFKAIETTVRQALESAGYHRPQRGNWRRKRVMGTAIETTGEDATMETVYAGCDARERVRLKVQRCDPGATATWILVDQLAGRMKPKPDDAAPETAKRDWSRAIQYLHGRLEIVAAELAGPDPSPVEKLLAERAAFCQMDAERCDCQYEMSRATPNFDPKLLALLDRAKTRANGRLLASLSALARVRSLDLRNVQVNIGAAQQIIGQVGDSPDRAALPEA